MKHLGRRIRDNISFCSDLLFTYLLHKMKAPKHKSYCFLQISGIESIISIQRAFRLKFNADPLCAENIRRSIRQLETTECVCKGKSFGRPKMFSRAGWLIMSEQFYLHTPKKSVWYKVYKFVIIESKFSASFAKDGNLEGLISHLHVHSYGVQLVPDLDELDFQLDVCCSPNNAHVKHF